MNQPEFLPLLNALVAVLLTGNIFFIKKLVDRIESAVEGVQDLRIKVAILDTKLNPGKSKACHDERK